MEPTREVFGNISPTMQILFFLFLFLSLGIMVWRVVERWWLWRRGTSGEYEGDWRVWMRRLVVYGLAQKRVRKSTLAEFSMLFCFPDFCFFLLGLLSCLLRSMDQSISIEAPITCSMKSAWTFLDWYSVLAVLWHSGADSLPSRIVWGTGLLTG